MMGDGNSLDPTTGTTVDIVVTNEANKQANVDNDDDNSPTSHLTTKTTPIVTDADSANDDFTNSGNGIASMGDSVSNVVSVGKKSPVIKTSGEFCP